jgi:hypothetical protein
MMTPEELAQLHRPERIRKKKPSESEYHKIAVRLRCGSRKFCT